MSKCIVNTSRRKGNMSGELFLWHLKITSKNTLNYRSILFKITSFTVSHFNLPLWKAFLCDFSRFHCGWNNRQEHSEITISDMGGRKATTVTSFWESEVINRLRENREGILESSQLPWHWYPQTLSSQPLKPTANASMRPHICTLWFAYTK